MIVEFWTLIKFLVSSHKMILCELCEQRFYHNSVSLNRKFCWCVRKCRPKYEPFQFLRLIRFRNYFSSHNAGQLCAQWMSHHVKLFNIKALFECAQNVCCHNIAQLEKKYTINRIQLFHWLNVSIYENKASVGVWYRNRIWHRIYKVITGSSITPIDDNQIVVCTCVVRIYN